MIDGYTEKMPESKLLRQFYVIWVGQLLSSIGSGLTAFSLGVYVFQQTNTAVSFALVVLSSFLPSILIKPIGGVLADRYNRKAMMITGDLGAALGVLFIAVFIQNEPVALWQIYTGAAISSIFAGLHNPAYKALATDLLSEEQFAKAGGLMQLAAASQYLISPVIAGFLLGIADVRIVLLIDVLTFGSAIIAVLATGKSFHASKVKQDSFDFVKDLKEGWQSLVTHPGVVWLVAILSLITFCLGFLQVLLGPMVLSFTDAKTLGVMQSISAVGMLAGSLYVSVISKMKKYNEILFAGLGLAALSFSLTGTTTNVYFIVVTCFLFFCTLPFINTSADVLIRTNIPNDSQGRAWGLIGTISQLGYIIAYGSAGFLADRIFTPLLLQNGLLALTVGKVIGVGPGRGMGLLLILSGLVMLLITVTAYQNKAVRCLDNSCVVSSPPG